MMISAIKFESSQQDYLSRIDRFLEINNKLETDVNSWDLKDDATVNLIQYLKKSLCVVDIYRKVMKDELNDYLVIRNPVDECAHDLGDWKERNKTILHRISDPLDYADGHMSMIATKRYIENLDETGNMECEFEYVYSEPEKRLYFESRLPVLKKEVHS